MTNIQLSKELTPRSRSYNFNNLFGILADADYILEKAGKTTEVFREIMADPHVSCCVAKRKAGTLEKEWRISREKASDREVAFYEDIFENLDLDRIVSEILDVK